MKHTFFTLTLFLLALLSTSCGNKKVAYQNPLPMAFGDPFLLKASDGKYYMYGTGGVSNGFKVYSSDDLVTWTDEGVRRRRRLRGACCGHSVALHDKQKGRDAPDGGPPGPVLLARRAGRALRPRVRGRRSLQGVRRPLGLFYFSTFVD